MKNSRHSNPVNRGGNDEPKKKSHVTLFACILWYFSVHKRIIQHFLHM